MVMTTVMTCSLSGITSVNEVEINVAPEEDTTVVTENVDIKYQEAVQISELESVDTTNTPCKITGSIDVDESEVEMFPMAMSDSTVVAGTVSDYLTATEDAKIYNISLPAGVYLQAQLSTPANADLDYDLYLLDVDGNILAGSDYYTKLNGTSGTLPEALGYITSGETATYYLYVLSSVGESVSEAFTLGYSISIACDNYEIDKSVRQALAFTYGTDGAYIESRNLSSPIVNDCYVITVPSSRIYNKLNITATTSSANTCSVKVYQNIASDGYKMSRVVSGNTVAVSTGTHYIRVTNAKTMEQFDDLDIQNYRLTVSPVLAANSTRTGTGITNSQGEFEISISLPPAIGVNMYDVGTSYHYFDVCGVQASLNDNSKLICYYITFGDNNNCSCCIG